MGIVRAQETLNRGVVAVKSENTDVFISWRLLETDPSDIGFNVYRSENGANPVKINDAIITLDQGTNFTDVDADLTKNNEYIVRPVINGKEVLSSNLKAASANGVNTAGSGSFTMAARSESTLKATKAADPYVVVNLKSGNTIHFVWVGDLNGDGDLDYVVDRLDYTNGGCKIEAYENDGTYLWTVDFGTNSTNMDNISPGSATIDVGMWDGVTVGDVNGDGKAEVICKIANGVKFGDGSTWSNSSNTKQWIAVLNGATGAKLKYCAIPTDYLSVGPMACQLGIGNTNEIFAFMKNRNSDKSFNCMVCCFKMSSSLALKWKWLRGSTSAADGHQIRIVDLNQDGTDDFATIGFALNGTNGAMLYNLTSTSGIQHGDRFMVGKFDKSRTGLQGYGIQQDNSSGLRDYYYDATTGAMLWRHYGAVADLARGNVADLDPNYGGCEVWTFDGLYNGKSNTLITSSYPYPVLRMQWDADILDELYNDGKIENWNYSTNGVERQLTTWNYSSAVSSDRGAPMFLGDIMGDWREEAILTSSDFSKLVIFTTNVSTSISRTSFRNDRYYRNCMSTKGYIASSYTSYYMGDQTKGSEAKENTPGMFGSNLVIAPNPVSGNITMVNFHLDNDSESEVEIYNLAGSLVKTANPGILGKGDVSLDIDISGISAGTYVVKLKTAEKTYTGKMIKL
jgi:hypothetical protein